jgi:hypothetical protein
MFAIFNGFILTYIIYDSSGAQAYKDRMDSTLVRSAALHFWSAGSAACMQERRLRCGPVGPAADAAFLAAAPATPWPCRCLRRCPQQMLKKRRVPPALRKSILDYLAAKYSGRRVNQDEEVLRELPPAIRSQVRLGVCEHWGELWNEIVQKRHGFMTKVLVPGSLPRLTAAAGGAPVVRRHAGPPATVCAVSHAAGRCCAAAGAVSGRAR